jgi:hypothetical protein
VAIGAREVDPQALQDAFDGCQAGELTGTSRR